MPGELSDLPGGTATRRFAADHPAAVGHFPGNPIIPGAVTLREIVAAIVAVSDAARCRAIRSAKFHRPVHPGDTIVITWTATPEGEVRFSCSVTGSSRPAVTGALLLSAP